MNDETLDPALRREVTRQVAAQVKAMSPAEARQHMNDRHARQRMFDRIAKDLTTDLKGQK